MTGVVLCGGDSTRMGDDKGLLQHKSFTWAGIALNKFKALKLPVILSVSDFEYALYEEAFPGETLVKDDPALNIGGLLKAILSVHLYQPDHDLLVTASDMPDMQTKVLETLIAARATKTREAYAFRNKEHIEPLSAIYTAAGLQKINTLYKKGELNRFSLHHVLGVLDTHYLPMPPEWKSYFYNFNTPQDLRGK